MFAIDSVLLIGAKIVQFKIEIQYITVNLTEKICLKTALIKSQIKYKSLFDIFGLKRENSG